MALKYKCIVTVRNIFKYIKYAQNCAMYVCMLAQICISVQNKLIQKRNISKNSPGRITGKLLIIAPIVETKFLELAMSLLDFSPRIPLGTFSILLIILKYWAPPHNMHTFFLSNYGFMFLARKKCYTPSLP